MYVPQLTEIPGKEKEGFWKRTDWNAQVKELGRDQRVTETPCTEMRQDTTYTLSMLPETYSLPEVQRKSVYGSRGTKEKHSESIKTIQIKPHRAAVYW